MSGTFVTDVVVVVVVVVVVGCCLPFFFFAFPQKCDFRRWN